MHPIRAVWPGRPYPRGASWDGENAQKVELSYARRLGTDGVVIAAGRLFASMGLAAGVLPVGEAAWGDTELDLAFLPEGTRLQNHLAGGSLRTSAGGRLRLCHVMTAFPGALLVYGMHP